MIRALLVLVVAVVLLLVLYAMRRGWNNRMARQSVLPGLPAVPDEPGPTVLSATGLYVGSAFAQSWQDRVVHDGLGVRADAVATLHRDGLLLDRTGAAPIWLPRATWVQARLAPGLAGKVVGEGGLLVLRWRLGDTEVDTGFRADDKSSYPDWVHAIDVEVDA